MTCAEYKDIKSEGYEALALWMSKNNAKYCPKFATPMEKTDGCNHMQRTGCRAHLCWVCLMMFEESGPCYTHMTAAHGGNGLQIEWEDDRQIDFQDRWLALFNA